MKLKLIQIKLDPELQSRVTPNELVINEYYESIKAGVKMPPVTVYDDGTTKWLADGFQRLEGYKRAGFPEIEANVILGTRRAALLYSVGANDDHGLRRNNADKWKAVTTLLEDFEWGEWNDSEIARECKVSATFVAKVRSQVKAGDALKERIVKRGDKEYVMSVDKIGSKTKLVEPEYDEKEDKIEELATEFKAVAEENETLKSQLAVKLMEGTPEQKKEAQSIIEEQRETIKSLEAQVKGLTASRDSYQIKNSELIKQVNYWKKQAQKAA